MLLGIWSLISIGPLCWLVYSSLKTGSAFISNTWLPPSHPLFSNWWTTLTTTTLLAEPIGVYVLNSIIISIPATIGAVWLGALAAYGLLRFRVRGAGILWTFILLLLPVPVFAVMVPVTLTCTPSASPIAVWAWLLCILRSTWLSPSC